MGSHEGLKPWKAAPAWLDDNPLTPNEEYFKRVDEVVAMAARYNMVLVIGCTTRRTRKGPDNASECKAMGQMAGTTLQACNEHRLGHVPARGPGFEEVIHAIVQGLLDGDGGAHLITMHPDPGPKSSSFMHSEPWLSFNTIQTWSSELLNYGMVAADYKRPPQSRWSAAKPGTSRRTARHPFSAAAPGTGHALQAGSIRLGTQATGCPRPPGEKWWDTPGALADEGARRRLQVD